MDPWLWIVMSDTLSDYWSCFLVVLTDIDHSFCAVLTCIFILLSNTFSVCFLGDKNNCTLKHKIVNIGNYPSCSFGYTMQSYCLFSLQKRAKTFNDQTSANKTKKRMLLLLVRSFHTHYKTQTLKQKWYSMMIVLHYNEHIQWESVSLRHLLWMYSHRLGLLWK